MKVVTPKQMGLLEIQAYRDGSSESDFMEEAGNGVSLVAHDFAERNRLDRQVVLLCGKGNNAGDAYVAGIQLLHLDYEVTAYQLFPLNEGTNLCRQNSFSFVNEGGRIKEISRSDEITFPTGGIIIDGIFGTGFHGTVEEPIAAIIRKANESDLPIIAVDIPSGLNGSTGAVEGAAIVATITAFLGLPKTGFFLREGWNHVGMLNYVNYGLPDIYIQEAPADMIMLSMDMMRPLMPRVKRDRNKYEAGHVVALAGSAAYPGAGLLASLSALCSGAGIVHLLYPEEIKVELSSVPYELIKVPYKKGDYRTIIDWMNRADATFVGPGLGKSDETRELLHAVMPNLEKPCILDADGLNTFAEEEFPLPEETIMTPHTGEMQRLLHVKKIEKTREFLEKCRAFARDKGVTLILKGGPTFIFKNNEPILVNPRGDPGMATAGSGDVLTGLLASLVAQHVELYHAAQLGVYLHGMAGEYAASDLTSYCMTASDIISFFPDAFRPSNWYE